MASNTFPTILKRLQDAGEGDPEFLAMDVLNSIKKRTTGLSKDCRKAICRIGQAPTWLCGAATLVELPTVAVTASNPTGLLQSEATSKSLVQAMQQSTRHSLDGDKLQKVVIKTEQRKPLSSSFIRKWMQRFQSTYQLGRTEGSHPAQKFHRTAINTQRKPPTLRGRPVERSRLEADRVKNDEELTEDEEDRPQSSLARRRNHDKHKKDDDDKPEDEENIPRPFQPDALWSDDDIKVYPQLNWALNGLQRHEIQEMYRSSITGETFNLGLDRDSSKTQQLCAFLSAVLKETSRPSNETAGTNIPYAFAIKQIFKVDKIDDVDLLALINGQPHLMTPDPCRLSGICRLPITMITSDSNVQDDVQEMFMVNTFLPFVLNAELKDRGAHPGHFAWELKEELNESDLYQPRSWHGIITLVTMDMPLGNEEDVTHFEEGIARLPGLQNAPPGCLSCEREDL
ncbi:SubName: Full=Uncharacterized protein {ECO:0000313/EMBL:CCA74657.1} [Serendipita indica DSM 11827]|nr:SubName: Full=Uncharacterized protein {ECO:0000313/EMBL:CCA74657.1} [Serendipita indica DSM 11827]